LLPERIRVYLRVRLSVFHQREFHSKPTLIINQPSLCLSKRSSKRENMMAQSTATKPSGPAADNTAIRPFTISFPESELTEMRNRIKATRWPEKETVEDISQGPQLAMMQKLAEYWATDYDWSKCEARLQALPNFITEIDGLDIHFIHVRSKHEGALPVIITHGWPGSVIEQLKIVGPLTDPTAFDGTADDAFDVVIPSIPGYGFSGKPTTTGWDQARIARAWSVLMKRLGYTRYVAQGGDWGAIISDVFATQGHPELIGMHTNFPNAIPPEITKAAVAGSPAPTGLSAEEQRAYESVVLLFKTIPTQLFMTAHPQSLYGVADSPVGVAAWMIDHDPISLRMIARAFDGEPTGLTRDDVLDNATLFWLTNTTISAARLYAEGFGKADLGPKGISIPVAVSVFPDEIVPAPRSWAEKAYPNLIHYNQLPKGGHFAAWEQPELLTSELRTAFKSLR
jgi:pimeloyl-ACP methyl ester carboxylesterase